MANGTIGHHKDLPRIIGETQHAYPVDTAANPYDYAFGAGPDGPGRGSAMSDAEIRRMAAEMASQAADEVEAFWINPLNDFLMAGTPQAAARVLDQHPQLMSARATGLIDKFISDAHRKGDPAEARYPEERRALAEAYRIAHDFPS